MPCVTPVTIFLLLVLLACPARADEFSDFHIPEHRWRSLRADLGFLGSHENQDFMSGQSDRSSLSGDLGGHGQWGADADNRQWLVDVFLSANGVVNRFDLSSVIPLGPDFLTSSLSTDIDQWTELLLVAAETRRYWGALPIGIALRGSASGLFAQDQIDRTSDDRTSGSSGSTRTRDQSAEENRLSEYVVTAGASVGLGKVRNATGVYQARLLEERLLADREIAGPLTAAARARLAQLFYVELQYGHAHDLPAKFFWRDVETLLRQEGAVSDGFDAYALLHAIEGDIGLQFFRRTGFFIGPTIAVDNRTTTFRNSRIELTETFVNDTLTASIPGSISSRDEFSSNPVVVGAQAEYHRPLGLRWQVDLDGRALIDVDGSDRSTDVATRAELSHVLAERWLARAIVAQRRVVDGEAPGGFWTVNTGVGIDFLIEDQLRLNVSAFEEQGAVRFGPDRTFRRQGRVSLGLSYLFDGSLDVPGLIDPVRPQPGGTLNR